MGLDTTVDTTVALRGTWLILSHLTGEGLRHSMYNDMLLVSKHRDSK